MATTIRSHFESQLLDLRSRLFLMSGRVRDEFALAFQALVNRDLEEAEVVFGLDREVNHMQREIERDCITLISRQQPVAKDLQLIITVYNINVDLERMGDQAKGIARVTKRLHQKPLFSLPNGLAVMHRMAAKMHDDTFTAWEHGDLDLAREVISRDDEVDAIDGQIQSEFFLRMANTQDQAEIEALYECIRATREIERFADLLCNVARDIIDYVQETQYATPA